MASKGEITVNSLRRLLHCKAEEWPDSLADRLEAVNTLYRRATKVDVEEYVLEILERMNAPFFQRDREENLQAWETGWSENLEALKGHLSEENLRPRYFRPSKFFRYNKNVILPENPHLEYDLFSIVRYYLFNRHFCGFAAIYELGCGSCQNIYTLAKLFPETKIVGLDWAKASIEIIDLIAKEFDGSIHGFLFDMTAPPKNMRIEKNSLVFSIHALEQLGPNTEKLISFLLEQKPALVFHYEPILELYDKTNLYDYLAAMYSRTRNYLSGYLTALRNLARAGKIELIGEHRPYIGGVYHEASLVFWRPI
ncbi:MAG: class I SAM-dependent methyltransferase [Desulfobaccales bacterium]